MYRLLRSKVNRFFSGLRSKIAFFLPAYTSLGDTLSSAVVTCYGLINTFVKLPSRAVDYPAQFLLDPSVEPLNFALPLRNPSGTILILSSAENPLRVFLRTALNEILKDLDICVGCYACEVACKQENNVPIGTKWIRVIPIGPKKMRGDLKMDFLHEITDKCTFCEHRLQEDLLPRCVDNCPMNALKFCRNDAEILNEDVRHTITVAAAKALKSCYQCCLRTAICPFKISI